MLIQLPSHYMGWRKYWNQYVHMKHPGRCCTYLVQVLLPTNVMIDLVSESCKYLWWGTSFHGEWYQIGKKKRNSMLPLDTNLPSGDDYDISEWITLYLFRKHGSHLFTSDLFLPRFEDVWPFPKNIQEFFPEISHQRFIFRCPLFSGCFPQSRANLVETLGSRQQETVHFLCEENWSDQNKK